MFSSFLASPNCLKKQNYNNEKLKEEEYLLLSSGWRVWINKQTRFILRQVQFQFNVCICHCICFVFDFCFFICLYLFVFCICICVFSLQLFVVWINKQTHRQVRFRSPVQFALVQTGLIQLGKTGCIQKNNFKKYIFESEKEYILNFEQMHIYALVQAALVNRWYSTCTQRNCLLVPN